MKKVIWFAILSLIIGGNMQFNSFADEGLKKAIFAGGCFWCMEADFQEISGVEDVISGYTGGTRSNPTYEDYGKKGHIEAVQITYNPSLIAYEKLLDLFWLRVDPADTSGQFCDRGHEYTTVIFYHTEEQKRLAEESKAALEKSGKLEKPVATKIIKAGEFYPAEDYHQDYYKKNPIKYKFYRFNCGRDRRLKEIWGDAVDYNKTIKNTSRHKKFDREALKIKLTPLQYKVTQEGGTEPAFKNEYWDNTKEGIYVDILSGEPLFSSLDKLDSGTGWPSFTKPLEPGNIVEKEDRSLWMRRIELRSKKGDSHLGHVFNDGPPPTGLRYCINSAALQFIPKDALERQGYGEYKKIFQK